jgi:hypothetical protein
LGREADATFEDKKQPDENESMQIKHIKMLMAGLLGILISGVLLVTSKLYSIPVEGLTWKTVTAIIIISFLLATILIVVGYFVIFFVFFIRGCWFILGVKKKSGDDAKRLFAKSFKNIEKFIRLRPNDSSPLYPWCEYVVECAMKKVERNQTGSFDNFMRNTSGF